MKWRLAALGICLAVSSAAADPISSYAPATTPLAGDEITILVQPGTCMGSATCDKKVKASDIANAYSVPAATQTLPYTVSINDIGGFISLTGTGNLTVNSGVVPQGKFVCFVNGNLVGGGNITLAGTATLNFLPSTTIYPRGGGCLVARTSSNYDWSPGVIGGDTALLSILGQFSAPQRNVMTAIAISGSIYTPDFSVVQDFSITLVHASCPCTIANPVNLPVAGKSQKGMIKIIQSATGSDVVSWGTAYVAQGGISSIVLSTAANAVDYVPYHIDDGSRVILGGSITGALH